MENQKNNKAEHEIQRYYSQIKVGEENKKLNKPSLPEVGKSNLAVKPIKPKTNTPKSVFDALISFLLIFFNHN